MNFYVKYDSRVFILLTKWFTWAAECIFNPDALTHADQWQLLCLIAPLCWCLHRKYVWYYFHSVCVCVSVCVGVNDQFDVVITSRINDFADTAPKSDFSSNCLFKMASYFNIFPLLKQTFTPGTFLSIATICISKNFSTCRTQSQEHNRQRQTDFMNKTCPGTIILHLGIDVTTLRFTVDATPSTPSQRCRQQTSRDCFKLR